ncbi:alpha/beta hydrolase [Antrihabitans sp. YC3-6]|uniref:Alpha/beta hydrolase n=1 Tax=Antrihabitans stalagmiti TaxID=2799499 RepID=A0A934NVC0_9NOCA|nr:alpha/beta hydrolase [Antrihabitans stalagmiti]MBJ8341959.1 alpha/beta hydrolase [Antrihabitans stalagmiti]
MFEPARNERFARRADPPAMPVVFVHGMWLHAAVWEPWRRLFEQRGYATIAPGWPGEADTASLTRSNADDLNKIGLAAITDHYEAIIADLPATPVVVGHCFGGLVAQRLLARGFARAAIAIAPAPFRGIWQLSRDQLRTAGTVLSHPSWWQRTWMPTPEQFHHQVATTVDRVDADRIYNDYAVPAALRPLLEVGFANLTVGGAAAVDTRAARGPLLIVGGRHDRTAPEVVVRAAYRRQSRNSAVTELVVYDDRGHSMSIDSGWVEIADRVLEFLTANNLERVA